MPEKEVASISVVGYLNDVKVSQEDDNIILSIPNMYGTAAQENQEVILYADEATKVIVALQDGRRAAEAWDEEDEYALPEPIIEVSPMLPDPVPPYQRTNGTLEDKVEQYITAEVPFIIEYTKENGESIVRTVSPYEVEAIKDSTQFTPPKYVRGWDHQREDIRTFRLARIEALGPARQTYVHPE